MEETMLQLQDRHSWKDSLRRCCRVNKLTIELASAYTPLRFRAAYARFKAIYQRRTEDKAERWLENQLKAFEWFVVSLSLISDILIRNFGEKEIEVLNSVFYFKQPMTLLYQVRKLSEDPTSKNSWQAPEEALLKQIVLEQSDNLNRWNEFARKLYQVSQKKYFRTGKQCREKWLNHLDPNKKRGQWTQEEDIQVVKLFITDGRKWSQVSRKMGGCRTEHMVKNRYKTILSRQKKLFPEMRNETSLLKTFVYPEYAQKCANKNMVQEQEKQEPQPEVKTEKISGEQYNRQRVVDEEKNEEVEQNEQNQHHKQEEFEPLQSYVRQEIERPELKLIPQTSVGYQSMPQVFSPWYMGYPMTPTFSPFFVNVSSFSAFDANLSNQFYAPTRQVDRSQ